MLNADLAKELSDKLLKNSTSFKTASPFPYTVIDNFLPTELFKAAVKDFPTEEDETLWEKTAMEGVEVKMRSDWSSELDVPGSIRELVSYFNGGEFLRSLSKVTGIDCLISDPYYSGGGLNVSLPGGHLDVHVDGNYHDAMNVHRRLNLLLYLNTEWDEKWGGQLGFFDETGDKEVASISPIGNRLVVFETHDKTFHGHPEPLKCPEGMSRKSLILYYYTSEPRSEDQITVKEPHSALWRSQNWHDKRGNKVRDIKK